MPTPHGERARRINKRKVSFITYDDGYSPPKTVEMVRKLVEQDEVLLLFQSLGTPSNTAIQKYMNAKKCRTLCRHRRDEMEMIRRTSPGPWAGSRTTRPRRASTPDTSCRPSRTPRSPCSTRTTLWQGLPEGLRGTASARSTRR